jgi:hypothetical protein
MRPLQCGAFSEGIALWERVRRSARRWLAESGAQADARREEALHRIGADILDEPIPDKLQQALHGEQGEAEVKPEGRK